MTLNHDHGSIDGGSIGDDSAELSKALSENEEGPTNSQTQQELKAVLRNIQPEARGVQFSRLVIVLLFLVTGASVSAFTYLFLRGEEVDDYTEAVSGQPPSNR